MRKKSDAEMQRDRVVKTARTLIRLKHSLAADMEINELLPDTLQEFDEAMSQGRLLTVKADLAKALEEC